MSDLVIGGTAGSGTINGQVFGSLCYPQSPDATGLTVRGDAAAPIRGIAVTAPE